MDWIKFTRESFATQEDWESLCEVVEADPETTVTIKINFDANEAEIEEEE